MQDGEAKKWKSSDASNSPKLVPNDHVAYTGELVIGKNTGALSAIGGPCPIIAIYCPDAHLGALLHVCGGDAENNGDNHEELIDRLLLMEEKIAEKAICHVMLDELALPGFRDPKEEKKQKVSRKKYAKRMQKYLKEQGFKKVAIVSDGQGKRVELNTGEGTLRLVDDDGETTLESKY